MPDPDHPPVYASCGGLVQGELSANSFRTWSGERWRDGVVWGKAKQWGGCCGKKAVLRALMACLRRWWVLCACGCWVLAVKGGDMWRGVWAGLAKPSDRFCRTGPISVAVLSRLASAPFLPGVWRCTPQAEMRRATGQPCGRCPGEAPWLFCGPGPVACLRSGRRRSGG